MPNLKEKYSKVFSIFSIALLASGSLFATHQALATDASSSEEDSGSYFTGKAKDIEAVSTIGSPPGSPMVVRNLEETPVASTANVIQAVSRSPVIQALMRSPMRQSIFDKLSKKSQTSTTTTISKEDSPEVKRKLFDEDDELAARDEEISLLRELLVAQQISYECELEEQLILLSMQLAEKEKLNESLQGQIEIQRKKKNDNKCLKNTYSDSLGAANKELLEYEKTLGENKEKYERHFELAMKKKDRAYQAAIHQALSYPKTETQCSPTGRIITIPLCPKESSVFAKQKMLERLEKDMNWFPWDAFYDSSLPGPFPVKHNLNAYEIENFFDNWELLAPKLRELNGLRLTRVTPDRIITNILENNKKSLKSLIILPVGTLYHTSTHQLIQAIGQLSYLESIDFKVNSIDSYFTNQDSSHLAETLKTLPRIKEISMTMPYEITNFSTINYRIEKGDLADLVIAPLAAILFSPVLIGNDLLGGATVRFLNTLWDLSTIPTLEKLELKTLDRTDYNEYVKTLVNQYRADHNLNKLKSLIVNGKQLIQ